ncbi:MAG: hypothetical protein HY293_05485 [Planctomycetes bacterium]|nr:hypothetical protein [Planctomycetota bacterium]
MASFLELRGMDLARVRAVLGSGDEKFCAALLKDLPAEAQLRGLSDGSDEVRDWKRGVTALLLGQQGQSMSEREPLGGGDVVRAGPGLSLAFSLILRRLSPGAGGCRIALDGAAGRRGLEALLSRPLFGLESEGGGACWGAWSRAEIASGAALLEGQAGIRGLLSALQGNGRELVGLSEGEASRAGP